MNRRDRADTVECEEVGQLLQVEIVGAVQLGAEDDQLLPFSEPSLEEGGGKSHAIPGDQNVSPLPKGVLGDNQVELNGPVARFFSGGGAVEELSFASFRE